MAASPTSTADMRWRIDIVKEHDLVELLPLLRAYGELNHRTEDIPMTSDDQLVTIARVLVDRAGQEGMQLIARSSADDRTPVGFATLLWNWSTLKGGKLAILEDLYVSDAHRDQGIADQLIAECARLAGEHGALCLTWHTSVMNQHAQAVYDRCGAEKSDRWLNYTLAL